jgi:O-acetyl-ADP-ribose deacetylase (regulator of RNase III)
MKKFKEIKGDLIEGFKEGKFDVIAHGCNCFATFGAGIALTIKNEFPEAKKADLDLDKKIPIGKARLGKFSKTIIPIEKEENDRESVIYNLYTQLNPGKDFRFGAFKKALVSMKDDIEREYGFTEARKMKIGFPLIGCGIAGGNWNMVKEEIKEVFSNYNVTAVHFDKKVEGVNYWPAKKRKTKIKIDKKPRLIQSLSQEKIDELRK